MTHGMHMMLLGMALGGLVVFIVGCFFEWRLR